MALIARQSPVLPRKPPVLGLGVPCHENVLDHQQWGHERSLTTGDTRPWQPGERGSRVAGTAQAAQLPREGHPPCADDSTHGTKLRARVWEQR